MKTFDTIWKKGIAKMESKTISGIILDYLTNRVFRISIDKTMLTKKIVKTGAPQETVLISMLYTRAFQ